MTTDLQILTDFLRIPTPHQWLRAAIESLPLLLLDHAHCERKAAATAINFISKYPEQKQLVAIMSPLAREELLHFEKVIDLMHHRKIRFRPLPPSRYAQKLHQSITGKVGKERLCEQLLIGAIIEARSCERFFALLPYLEDEELHKFYRFLVKSEARHFECYLDLAKKCGIPYLEKLNKLLTIENDLIRHADQVFRFHSGIPG